MSGRAGICFHRAVDGLSVRLRMVFNLTVTGGSGERTERGPGQGQGPLYLKMMSADSAGGFEKGGRVLGEGPTGGRMSQVLALPLQHP